MYGFPAYASAAYGGLVFRTLSANPVQIFSGGTEITEVVDWRSIDLNLVLTKEVSTLAFDILITPASTPFIPVIGAIINLYEIQDDGLTAHVFGGTVTERELVVDGGIQARYTITVTDWGYALDAKMIAKTYTNEDPADIVRDIIANYASGFTVGNVHTAGYTIPSIKFNYQPPSKCIQKIATLIGWDWFIDADKDLHFFRGDVDNGAGAGAVAPFNLDDTSGNLEWPTIDLDENTQNMKNSVFVIGSTYKKTYDAGSAIDVYPSHAGQTTYPLVYPYDKSTLTVTLDGTTQTVGVYGQDDPGSFNVLYSNASGGPAFVLFTTDPGDGHTIKIFGDAEVPILGYANDADSIATFGEFQDTIVDRQITTVAEAQQRALAEVIQFGAPIDDLKFSTLKKGLMIGQTITLSSNLLGINVTLIIKRIQGLGYSPTQLEYQVEAIGAGANKVSFVDLMGVLLEQEINQNSVDDSTILQVLVRITESLAVTDSIPAPTTSAPPFKWGSFKWGFMSWS